MVSLLGGERTTFAYPNHVGSGVRGGDGGGDGDGDGDGGGWRERLSSILIMLAL